MTYFELSPAYGRDYKNAWISGKDFEGDYQLGFKPVNIADIPKPCTVNLRYARSSKLAVVKVPLGATTQGISSAPKVAKKPSIATLELWLMNGVAKSTDGCTVEPDGHCEHGKPSWLIAMGPI